MHVAHLARIKLACRNRRRASGLFGVNPSQKVFHARQLGTTARHKNASRHRKTRKAFRLFRGNHEHRQSTGLFARHLGARHNFARAIDPLGRHEHRKRLHLAKQCAIDNLLALDNENSFFGFELIAELGLGQAREHIEAHVVKRFEFDIGHGYSSNEKSRSSDRLIVTLNFPGGNGTKRTRQSQRAASWKIGLARKGKRRALQNASDNWKPSRNQIAAPRRQLTRADQQARPRSPRIRPG